MTLPALTPGHLRQLSPEGRLERHEAILDRVGGQIPEDEIATYRRYVQVARANWERDSFNARIYLEKAEQALTDLKWRRSAEVAAGLKQIRRDTGPTPETMRILDFIASWVAANGGKGIQKAAAEAKVQGLGTSVGANSKLWYEWTRKGYTPGRGYNP